MELMNIANNALKTLDKAFESLILMPRRNVRKRNENNSIKKSVKSNSKG